MRCVDKISNIWCLSSSAHFLFDAYLQASGAAPWWTYICPVSAMTRRAESDTTNTLFSSFFSRWGPWSLHHHRDRWIVSPYEDGVMRINMVHIIVPKCKGFLNHVGSYSSFNGGPNVSLVPAVWLYVLMGEGTWIMNSSTTSPQQH